MGNIPTHELPRGRTAAVRAPQFDVQTGDMGEGVARGVQQFGQGVTQAASNFEKYRAEADATQVQTAETLLLREVNRRVYEGEKAFINQRGENAYAYHGDVLEGLARERERIDAELANDTQRKHFAKRSEAILTAARRTADAHLSRETLAVQRDSDKARLVEAVRTAANSYADEDQASLHSGLQEDFDRAASLREGESDVAARARRRSSAQAIHEARLGAALQAADYDAAEKILNNHSTSKDDGGAAIIDPATAKRARDVIADARDKVANERTSMQILSTSRNDAGWVDAAKAKAALDELPETKRILAGEGTPRDVERKAAVEADLQRALADEERKRAASAENMLNEANIYLDESGGNLNDKRLAKIDAYFRNPANGYSDRWTSVKARIKREKQAAANLGRASAADARREQAEADKQAIDKYLEVANGSLGKAAALPVDVVFGGASATARQHIKALQAKDRKRVEGGGEAKWNEAKDMAWGEVKDRYAKDKKRATAFAGFFREWFNKWELEHEGDSPTKADVRKFLGEKLILGEEEDFLFDNDVYAWEREAGLADPNKPWKPAPAERQPSRLARESMGTKAAAPTPQAPAPTPPPAPGSDLEPLVAPQAPVDLEPLVRTPAQAKAAIIAELRAKYPGKPGETGDEKRRRLETMTSELQARLAKTR